MGTLARIVVVSLLLQVINCQYYLKDQTLGCDGLIGSGKTLDRCGVCGGDNTSCKIISGIYTKKTLGAKYDPIADLPIGAVNINITEAKNSRNYLSLRYKDSQIGILNANWSLDWSGEYKAAGSKIIYSKPRHGGSGETITIDGPLTHTVQLLLLTQARNPGIYYSYAIPLPDRQPARDSLLPSIGSLAQGPSPVFVRDSLDEQLRSLTDAQLQKQGYHPAGYARSLAVFSRNSFEWKVINTEQCSKSCGEGYRESRVVCVQIASSVTVTDENCLWIEKPEERKIRCNTQPCPAEWVTGDWSKCAATCGQSTQSRTVECKRRISENLEISVYAVQCDSKSKPSTVKMCSLRECYVWQSTPWTGCSAVCGAGTRSREVDCIDADGKSVEKSLCQFDEPRQKETCYSTCDQAWFLSDWSEQCSDDCGRGNKSRQAYCPADADTFTIASKCGKKPEITQECDTTQECNANGKWFTGEWGVCIGSCAEAYQMRTVLCMKRRGFWHGVTYESDCVVAHKPEERQKCRPLACDTANAMWFATDWGSCSVTCGNGYERRQARCLDSAYGESQLCKEDTKPQLARPCQAGECPVTQLSDSPVIDPNCIDQFSTCKRVMQARLCRLPYYKEQCCASCAHQ